MQSFRDSSAPLYQKTKRSKPTQLLLLFMLLLLLLLPNWQPLSSSLNHNPLYLF